MNALRLQSFRSLVDTGFVELRPLTILLGRNSSGKSTFLRFLPLLRQSVEARTTGPIQWYGDYVDFGGFEETLSRSAKLKEMSFGLRLRLDCEAVYRRLARRYYRYYHYRRRPIEFTPASCELELTMVPDPKDNSVARFRSVALRAADHAIHIDIEGTTRVAKILINGREPFREVYSELRLRSGSLLPLIQRRRVPGAADAEYRHGMYGRSLAIESLVEQLDPMFHGNTKLRTKYQVAEQLSFASDEQLLELLRKMRWPGKRWVQSVGRLQPSTTVFREIRDWIVANSIGAIIEELDSELWRLATGVRYARPVRAAAERYYRQQGLAVDEVDPAGSNLAVFLRGFTDTERRDFEEWTYRELGWRIVARLAGGHVSLRLETKNGMGYNLADVGFGFSQVLPVLIQLWSMQRSRRHERRTRRSPLTFAIEQPELHLHPSFQAQLADILVTAIAASQRGGGGLAVLIETHSETIVSRVGEMVMAGEINPDDVGIVLFNSLTDGTSDVRLSGFDSQGYLTDWPFGFFDPD